MIVETSQAAEITAAMLRRIPGALRGPKIAAIATNATAAIIKMEDCIGLVGLKAKIKTDKGIGVGSI
jgi:hypothetical protein